MHISKTYLNTNELNPQEIFETMKSDFYKISEFPLISKEYIRKRRDIINFNHKLTKKMGCNIEKSAVSSFLIYIYIYI